MDKIVTFIGGTNGAGKSHITAQLVEEGDYTIKKQKRELIKVGDERGIPYEEIPENYDALIVPAAEQAVEDFAASDERVLLFECHYAFQKKRAVTIHLEGEIPDGDEAYQQAVDDRLISEVIDRFPTGFVFLYVDPEIAYRRLKSREKNIEDEEITLEEVRERQAAERTHYDGIIEKFDVAEGYRTIIDTSSGGDEGKEELEQFCESSVRAC